MNYQLTSSKQNGTVDSAKCTIQNATHWFAFDIGNPDYRQFKVNLLNGSTLNDINGSPMTAAQITAFLATIP